MTTPDSIHIIDNLIDESQCDYFVNKMLQRREARELLMWNDIPGVLVPNTDKEDQEFISEVTDKTIQHIKDAYKFTNVLNTFDSNLYLWRTGVESQFHVDNSDHNHDSKYNIFASVFYLNDDYEGGELSFPNLNFSYKPRKNSAILFPVDFIADWSKIFNDAPHAHKVEKVLSGFRITVASWFNSGKTNYVSK